MMLRLEANIISDALNWMQVTYDVVNPPCLCAIAALFLRLCVDIRRGGVVDFICFNQSDGIPIIRGHLNPVT